jgi:hypothetical protein
MLELASPKAHGVDGPDMGQDSLPRVASHVACIYAHRSLRCLLSTPELYESLAESLRSSSRKPSSIVTKSITIVTFILEEALRDHRQDG